MFTLLGVAIAAVPYVVAQMQNANCSATGAEFEWSFNSLHQSPCTIASKVGTVCAAIALNIPPLAQGQFYLGARQDQATNECICSSVFYSLVSACALCQQRGIIPWSTFNKNCTPAYLTVLKPDIPANTSIPHYAYLDVSINDKFDPEMARAVTSAPESTSGSTSPTGAPSPGSSPSKAGPIAGGVVGGVVFIALVAAAAFWWVRRRRHANSTQSIERPSTNISGYGRPTPMSFDSGQTSISPFSGAPSSLPKLYNPSDPSTYPSTSATSTVFTTPPEHQPFLYPVPPSDVMYQPQMNPQGRNYTGAAEI